MNGKLHGMDDALKDIKESLEDNGRAIAELHGTLAENLTSIAASSRATAETLADLKDERMDLVGIAAGKRQVPLSLAVIFLLLAGAYVLVDRVRESGINVKIPYLGIEITHAPAHEKK